jgi:hypothetical protein
MGAVEARELAIRAEMAVETGDLTAMLTEILAGAEQAGADPAAVTGLTAAIKTLDPSAGIRYNAGDPSDRRRNTGYPSEWEFLEAVSDAEDEIARRRREAAVLSKDVTAALEESQAELADAREAMADARDALAAAYAMPTRVPCTGCHGEKEAAISAAEAAIAAAEAQIADAIEAAATCEAAAEILQPLLVALVGALACVRRVPQDLGEVYELVYSFVRGGGKLPAYARWVEGVA